MNRHTAILTTSLAILALSACTPAEVKQFLAATKNVKPAPAVVVNTEPAAVYAHVLTVDQSLGPCELDNGSCSPTPESNLLLPPYTCGSGSQNGDCAPAPESDPDAPPPPDCDNDNECIRG